MIRSYGISEVGLVRKVNEDSIRIGDKPFFILADGMGGYEGGQIASTSAVQAAESFLIPLSETTYSEEQIRKAILCANQAILRRKIESGDLAYMGTTMVVAAISGSHLFWGHVGDSRLYIFSENILTQITKDHSFVMTLVEEGKLTREEMSTHPRKNEITRAVGISGSLDVDTGYVDLPDKSLILICSDGLTTLLSDDRIEHILSSHGRTETELQSCGNELMREVYAAGATDNTSAILIYVENNGV